MHSPLPAPLAAYCYPPPAAAPPLRAPLRRQHLLAAGAMGDDELDEASKLKIAANFINYSPPGQIQKVVEGERPAAPRLQQLAGRLSSADICSVQSGGAQRKQRRRGQRGRGVG